MEGEPCGAQWDPVDPEDWSTVGRPAGSLSVVSNLPPAVSAVGARGCAGGVLEVLAQALHDEGYLDLQETFIDGSFAPAKQGGAGVGKTKRGKGSKIMAIADRRGLPVAVHIESATPAKSPWSTQPSRSGLSSRSLCVSSVTTPTSRTAWMPTWPAVAWN